MHNTLALVLKNITPIFFLPFSFTFLCLVSCTDDTPKTEPSAPVEKKITPVAKTIIKKEKLDFPVVYVEELDQSQEFYKEQHETSFSFVREKNWFSYTPEKKGILTKILLFGKPNYKPSDHYGDSMQGFIRKGNPEKGPKLGNWELSRDDIVNQLLAQGMSERDGGWITIRMRGEIEQEIGQTYFFVCDKIIGGKPWFGAFAFGDGNPYKPGRFWLHKDHDLVFRTYIGKTPEQVALEQKNLEKIDNLGLKKNLPIRNDNLDDIARLPQSQNPKSNFVPNPSPESIENNPQQSNSTSNSEKPASSEDLNFIESSPAVSESESNNSKENKSLFNRLFKK